MAELCDVHINTYRLWEDKPSDIKLGKALDIAKVLGISVEDIIFCPKILRKVVYTIERS